MNKNNPSQPYRNLRFEKIDAPEKKKAPLKVTKTVGGDLRVGGKKR